MMSQIAVLGATGTTGMAVVREALDMGYHVKALVRTPENFNIEHPALKIVRGSANDLGVVVDLLKDCVSAISTLGPGFDKKVAANMVSTAATKNVIQAMGMLDIQRYVVMSGASVVMSGDRPFSWANLVTRFVFPFLLGDILKDKYSELELLKASKLNWTLVRCPGLLETDRPGNFLINETMHKTLKVEKTTLAEFLVSQLESDRYSRMGVFACTQR